MSEARLAHTAKVGTCVDAQKAGAQLLFCWESLHVEFSLRFWPLSGQTAVQSSWPWTKQAVTCTTRRWQAAVQRPQMGSMQLPCCPGRLAFCSGSMLPAAAQQPRRATGECARPGEDPQGEQLASPGDKHQRDFAAPKVELEALLRMQCLLETLSHRHIEAAIDECKEQSLCYLIHHASVSRCAGQEA